MTQCFLQDGIQKKILSKAKNVNTFLQSYSFFPHGKIL